MLLNSKLLLRESSGYLKFVFKGRLVSYVIGLVATPVIMGLFDPGPYGQVTIAIMAGTIIGQVSTLAFEKASLVEKNHVKAALLLQLAALFSLGVFCIGLAVLVAFYLNGNVDLIQAIHGQFILVAMICEALACIVIADRISSQRLSRVANGEVIQTVITALGRIIAGFIGFISITTLFLWYCFGVIAKILYLNIDNKRSLRPKRSEAAKFSTIRRLFSDYSDFPKYNVPIGLMNQLTTYLPLFIFGVAFGPVVAGFYAISRRFIKAPGNLFVNMVTPVLTRRFSSIASSRIDLSVLIRRTALIFGVFGLFSAASVFLFTTFVLSKVITVEWSQVSTMLTVLLPMVVVPFISVPVAAAMTALRQQKRYLSNQTFVSTIRILTLLVGISLDLSWEQAAGLFAWVSILLTIISSYFLYSRYLFNDCVIRRC